MDSHRESCRRQHRVLGHFLAVQSWLRRLDCIVLVRADLEVFLGLERLKSARVEWFCEDLEPWFPHQSPYYKTRARSSLHSLFLSRVPIAEWLPPGSMTLTDRIAGMKQGAPKTEQFSAIPKGNRRVKEADVVKYLAVLDSGLSTPAAMSSVSVKSA